MSSLQQAVAPNGLQVAAEISTVVMAVISAVLLLVILLVTLQLKRLLGALSQHVQPVTERARVAAENVEYITGLVRQDVQKVRSSVTGLSDRLGEASERMEERVEEFNALMDVVQTEAEAVLLDTAAIVRGVRAGAQTVGGSVGRASSGAHSREPTALEGGEDAEAGGETGQSARARGDADQGSEGDRDRGQSAEPHGEVGDAMAKEAPESG